MGDPPPAKRRRSSGEPAPGPTRSCSPETTPLGPLCIASQGAADPRPGGAEREPAPEGAAPAVAAAAPRGGARPPLPPPELSAGPAAGAQGRAAEPPAAAGAALRPPLQPSAADGAAAGSPAQGAGRSVKERLRVRRYDPFGSSQDGGRPRRRAADSASPAPPSASAPELPPVPRTGRLGLTGFSVRPRGSRSGLSSGSNSPRGGLEHSPQSPAAAADPAPAAAGLTAEEKRARTVDSRAELRVRSGNRSRLSALRRDDELAARESEFEAAVEAADEPLRRYARRIIDIWTAPKGIAGSVLLEEDLAGHLRDHQISGIRFMWRNIVATDRLHGSDGDGSPQLGCILAHSMGLGKTAQALVFIALFLRQGLGRTALVVAPKSTVPNWTSEFHLWCERGRLQCDNPCMRLHSFVDSDVRPRRRQTVRRWARQGGVLLVGYEQYALLTEAYRGRRGFGPADRDELCAALRSPGPDLVVCDEGHLLKNPSTALSRSLQQLQTRRRVLLTGTPLQNHLSEYWTMIEFIRPGYFPQRDFAQYFQVPIREGQRFDSTAAEITRMKQRAHILQHELRPFVQRRDQQILVSSLPAKSEVVILCPLSEFQQSLYRRLREAYADDAYLFHPTGRRSVLYFVSMLNKICGHPDLLRNFLIDKQRRTAGGDGAGAGLDMPTGSPSPWTWAADLLLHRDYRPSKISDSPKVLTLLHIVEQVVRHKEKLLVFSQYVQTLDLLERFVEQMLVGARSRLRRWRLDGSSSDVSRESSIREFQQHDCSSGGAIFFISTRAGGLGINLSTAHRTVLFDVSFNPAIDQQAIFRSYRYGLRHPIHIYRLVADGTPESRIYSQCISKEWLAKKVVDESVPTRDFVTVTNLSDVFDDLQTRTAEELTEGQQRRFEHETRRCLALDPLLHNIWEKLRKRGLHPRRIFRHDSLLIDGGDRAGQQEREALEEYCRQGGRWNLRSQWQVAQHGWREEPEVCWSPIAEGAHVRVRCGTTGDSWMECVVSRDLGSGRYNLKVVGLLPDPEGTAPPRVGAGSGVPAPGCEISYVPREELLPLDASDSWVDAACAAPAPAAAPPAAAAAAEEAAAASLPTAAAPEGVSPAAAPPQDAEAAPPAAGSRPAGGTAAAEPGQLSVQELRQPRRRDAVRAARPPQAAAGAPAARPAAAGSPERGQQAAAEPAAQAAASAEPPPAPAGPAGAAGPADCPWLRLKADVAQLRALRQRQGSTPTPTPSHSPGSPKPATAAAAAASSATARASSRRAPTPAAPAAAREEGLSESSASPQLSEAASDAEDLPEMPDLGDDADQLFWEQRRPQS